MVQPHETRIGIEIIERCYGGEPAAEAVPRAARCAT